MAAVPAPQVWGDGEGVGCWEVATVPAPQVGRVGPGVVGEQRLTT